MMISSCEGTNKAEIAAVCEKKAIHCTGVVGRLGSVAVNLWCGEPAVGS